jgi:2-polyprenyl-3-methyl-5-hydroxy-6-metoxy-1,4-benzoquinol methylase
VRRLDARSRRLLAHYEDPRTRWPLTVRWATAPLPAVAAQVPRTGRILDVGCGLGLLDLHLADESPARVVHGVDVDGRKTTAAADAAAAVGLGGRVTFATVGPGWEPCGTWDAVVVVDMLYLLGRPAGHALVRALAGAVEPGGRLVVKEMATRPRWKHAWNLTQERLARAGRLTVGSSIDPLEPQELVPDLERLGFRTRLVDLSRGYVHPHQLLVADRPAACCPTPR